MTNPAVVVVGSINADLISRVARHPAPGETVLGSDLEVLPGGKGANQAVAAANLGADVALVGAIGTDEFADAALSGLRKAGVDLSAVDVVPGPTGTAIITVDEAGENSIVVVPGANSSLTGERVDDHKELISDAKVVVVQGEIPLDGIEAAARLATGRLLVNLAPVVPLPAAVLRQARPLVVNEHEALGALELLRGDAPGVEISDDVPASDHLTIIRLLVQAGVPEVVLTLGAAGALVAKHVGDEIHLNEFPAPKVEAVDTTGAGDAFVGALAARLAESATGVVEAGPFETALETTPRPSNDPTPLAGSDLEQAVQLAVRVGAYAVTGRGAQPSYPTALDQLPSVECRRKAVYRDHGNGLQCA